MRLPSWLTLFRRARRNRRHLPQVPFVESLEDRTLLTLLWDFDPGTGHLAFTTDDVATTVIIQAPAANSPIEVVGVGQTGLVDPDEVLEPSPVLEAMGVDAQRSLRLSVGWNTTDADLDAALDVVPGILGDLRALR